MGDAGAFGEYRNFYRGDHSPVAASANSGQRRERLSVSERLRLLLIQEHAVEVELVGRGCIQEIRRSSGQVGGEKARPTRERGGVLKGVTAAGLADEAQAELSGRHGLEFQTRRDISRINDKVIR